MKTVSYFFTIAVLAMFACSSGNSANTEKIVTQVENLDAKADSLNLYNFKIELLTGGELDLKTLQGKKVLIVNTASECGFTGQYENLQKLAAEYKSKVVLIGFPANNFGGQEPGTNNEISTFCKKNYGVDFIMSQKVSVKGDDQTELFKWLTSQPNPDFTGSIKWNFEKFLIDENGKLVRRYRSTTDPLDEEIVSQL